MARKLTKEERAEQSAKSGLDRLRSFIPAEDYTDDLISHAAANISGRNNPEGDGMSPERQKMIARGAAILQYMRDNGYDYSVVPDRNSGQVKVKLNDRNFTMRILDTDNNANYAGAKIYDNGQSIRFKQNAQYAAANGGRQVDDMPDVTPDMAVDLLKYSLGKSINMRAIDTKGEHQVNIPVGLADDENTLGSKAPNVFVTKGVGKGSHSTYRYVNNQLNVNNNIDIYVTQERGSRDIAKFYADEAKGMTELDVAEEFIRNSRNTAAANFTERLKLDAIEKLAESKAKGEFDGEPEYSPDSESITSLQKKYFKERTQIYGIADDAVRSNELDRHRQLFMEENVEKRFGSIDDRSIDPVQISAYMDESKSKMDNEASMLKAMKIVNTQSDTPYEIIGDEFFSKNFKNKMVEFNAQPVFDDTGKQIYPMNINPDSEDFDKNSEFWQSIGRTVYDTASQTGVRIGSIQVDEKGVIAYEGTRTVGAFTGRSKPVSQKVTGSLGQVFEPESNEYNPDGSLNIKKGLIKTKFNSGDNYYIAPGYTAYIQPPADENDTSSYVERTRLRGYRQQMTDAISSQLRHDLVVRPDSSDNYDASSSLNKVYAHLYDDRIDLDFEEQLSKTHKGADFERARIETMLGRVRYDSQYGEATSMTAQMNIQDDGTYNIYRDNVKACIAIMNPELSEGYFDPGLTSSGRNQGQIRYLAKGVQVDPDTGAMTKSTESTYSPFYELDIMKYGKAGYNTADREVMAGMNAMSADDIAQHVGIAHMALGGWNQDDAFIVSKEFAEEYTIHDEDGGRRALKVGDKLSDVAGGNKGVISLVVDRNMDLSNYQPLETNGKTGDELAAIRKENQQRAMIRDVVQIYRDNPDLDIIGAPYTATSRFNGGTAHECLDSQSWAHENGKSTVLKMNGKEYAGSIAYGTMAITDKSVDDKTHSDKDGGRNFSGQVVEALAELGAYEVINETYEFNSEPVVKAREMLIAMGLDMDQKGRLHIGYEPHQTGYDKNGQPTFEQRKEISAIEEFNSHQTLDKKTARSTVNNKEYKKAFDEALVQDGGFMKLPFPITMKSGESTSPVMDENGNPTGEYRLPILAARFRSSRETVDGTLSLHEYTSDYKRIWDAAKDYLKANDEKDPQAARNAAVDAAQSAYDRMGDDIANRYFTGKHNIWKDGVMRSQLNGAPTAVITPDPRLDLSDIRMPRKMAEDMGIADDENPKVVFWRDPMLSGGGIRSFNVNIIETREGRPGYNADDPMSTLTGVAMNPSAATSFEGDFDGDSVGLNALKTAAAKANAEATLTYEAQLLNKEAGNLGHHKMYFQDGLDVASGLYYDGLAGGNARDRMEYARFMANAADVTDYYEARHKTKHMSDDMTKTLLEANHASKAVTADNFDTQLRAGYESVESQLDESDNESAYIKNMLKFGLAAKRQGIDLKKQAYETYNTAMHDAHSMSMGKDLLCYDSEEKYFESLLQGVQSGAKGSIKKLQDGYAKYFGVKVEIDDDYNIKTFEDIGHPTVDKDERIAGFMATHAKAYLTGVAGKFLQHGIMVAKNAENPETGEKSCAAAANALTHPVTQSVMQLKHNTADEIGCKIKMVMEVAPDLWAGYKIERCRDEHGNDTWRTCKTDKGYNIPCAPNEWKKQFVDFYTDKNGLNVETPNPEHVETIAKLMTVPNPRPSPNAPKYIIKGFDRKSKEAMPNAANLDDLTYEAKWEKVVGKALDNAPLFDDNINKCMAPISLKHNFSEAEKAARDTAYKPKFVPIAARDTQIKSYDEGSLHPSVNAVDRAIKVNPDAEIKITPEVKTEWTREGYTRTNKDGSVSEVKSITVHRDYENFTPEQKQQTARRLAEIEMYCEKYVKENGGNAAQMIQANYSEGDIACKADIERQKELYKSITTREERESRKSEFSELQAYASRLKELRSEKAASLDLSEVTQNAKAERQQAVQKSYGAMTPEEQSETAKSAALKKYTEKQTGAAAELTRAEKELIDMAKEQAEYKKNPDSPESAAYHEAAQENAYREFNMYKTACSHVIEDKFAESVAIKTVTGKDMSPDEKKFLAKVEKQAAGEYGDSYAKDAYVRSVEDTASRLSASIVEKMNGENAGYSEDEKAYVAVLKKERALMQSDGSPEKTAYEADCVKRGIPAYAATCVYHNETVKFKEDELIKSVAEKQITNAPDDSYSEIEKKMLSKIEHQREIQGLDFNDERRIAYEDKHTGFGKAGPYRACDAYDRCYAEVNAVYKAAAPEVKAVKDNPVIDPEKQMAEAVAGKFVKYGNVTDPEAAKHYSDEEKAFIDKIKKQAEIRSMPADKIERIEYEKGSGDYSALSAYNTALAKAAEDSKAMSDRKTAAETAKLIAAKNVRGVDVSLTADEVGFMNKVAEQNAMRYRKPDDPMKLSYELRASEAGMDPYFESRAYAKAVKTETESIARDISHKKANGISEFSKVEQKFMDEVEKQRAMKEKPENDPVRRAFEKESRKMGVNPYLAGDSIDKFDNIYKERTEAKTVERTVSKKAAMEEQAKAAAAVASVPQSAYEYEKK